MQETRLTGLTQDRLTRSNSPVQIWLSSPLNHSASPFLSHANQVQYLYCKTRYDALNCFFFTIFPKCYFKNNSRQDKSGATPENINKFYFLKFSVPPRWVICWPTSGEHRKAGVKNKNEIEESEDFQGFCCVMSVFSRGISIIYWQSYGYFTWW